MQPDRLSMDRSPGPAPPRVAALNDSYRHHGATAVLERAFTDAAVGQVALVSSFGAESVVLLHLVSVIAPSTPVLFIDTEMLFPETLAYQQELAHRLPLTDIRVIRADPAARQAADPDNRLHRRDADACCALRKTEPLERALAPFDAWITGRKRYQGSTRAALEFFEAETPGRIKINPLAHWGRDDIEDYIVNNRLPRHPLVARGYPSLGCAPCTSPVAAGEDPRAGRWRGTGKVECGIHYINGKVVRMAAPDRTMNAIVRDDGFHPEDWTGEILDLAQDTRLDALPVQFDNIGMIRLAFPAFNDGRSFTLARHLRARGFKGRLRAHGHVIADQYAMLRRAGFDEVEISAELSRRQPEDQWRFRADWRAHDYRARLSG